MGALRRAPRRAKFSWHSTPRAVCRRRKRDPRRTARGASMGKREWDTSALDTSRSAASTKRLRPLADSTAQQVPGTCPICRNLFTQKCARRGAPSARAAAARHRRRPRRLAGIQCEGGCRHEAQKCDLTFGSCGCVLSAPRAALPPAHRPPALRAPHRCVFHTHCMVPWTQKHAVCPVHDTPWQRAAPTHCAALGSPT